MQAVRLMAAYLQSFHREGSKVNVYVGSSSFLIFTQIHALFRFAIPVAPAFDTVSYVLSDKGIEKKRKEIWGLSPFQ